jgi:hypothetical protein
LRGAEGGSNRWGEVRNDYINRKPDQLSGKLGGSIALPLGIAELDCDIVAFRIAKRVQAFCENIGKRIGRRGGYQHADKR